MRAIVLGLVGAVAAAGAAQALEGTYHGSGSESGGYSWLLYAKLSRADGGRTKVHIEATNASCASMVEGIGVIHGQDIQVSGDCDLTITVAGKFLSIKEGPSCASMHGASCTYDGNLKKSE